MDDHNSPWTPKSLPRSASSRPSDFTPHPSSPYMTGPDDSIVAPPAPAPWHEPSGPKGPKPPTGPRANMGCLLGGGGAALVLIVIIVFLILPALNDTPKPTSVTAATRTATTNTAFLATVTPAPGATVTPTVGPGTPTVTPVVVYITAVPSKPLPTYTARPNQPTYTPSPTYTTPPAPTATATARPLVTETDDLNDLSMTSGHSSDIVCCDTGYASSFAGDPSRVVDTCNPACGGFLTYSDAGLRRAQVTLYYSPNYPVVPCDFLVSADGQTWQGVQATYSDNGGTWDQRVYTLTGLSGNDFEIRWNSPNAYSPELGQVVLTAQS